MAIEYRVCTENPEFEQVTDMEILVWGMGERDVVSPHTLHVLTHAGGNVMGAFDGEQMIGCTVAFAMREPKRLWSHFAAVHPDYQGQKIGYTLKQKQREWALAQGLERMSWTFDPAMRRNAHFNFHLLHVQSNTYHVNFYGEMGDDINRGIASDRMEAMWFLTQKMEYNPLAKQHSCSKPMRSSTPRFYRPLVSNGILSKSPMIILLSSLTKCWHNLGVKPCAKFCSWLMQMAIGQSIL